jgi:hypothetical protein
MTKPIPAVVHQFEEFVELNVCELEELFTSSLPNVVFSDLEITKMQDSLPMALFRFNRLAPIVNAGVADSDAA